MWCSDHAPVLSFAFYNVFEQMCPRGFEHYLKVLVELKWEVWLESRLGVSFGISRVIRF